MKCPSCSTDLMIKSNNFVHRQDGTYAHKLVMTCRNKKCPNFGKAVTSVYHPVEVSEDDNSEDQ